MTLSVPGRSVMVMAGRRGLDETIQAVLSCPPTQRAALLERRVEEHERCAVTRYLLGCLAFDARQPSQAVRHMMVAAHAEPDLQSASLLVFAGLNLVSRRNEPLLAVLVETWEEFRRPGFDRTARERRLLDALAEPAPDWPANSLARQLWRLPIPLLRSQLAAAGRDEAGRHPLLVVAV